VAHHRLGKRNGPGWGTLDAVTEPTVLRSSLLIALIWCRTIGSIVGFGVLAFVYPEPNRGAPRIVIGALGVVGGLGFLRGMRSRVEFGRGRRDCLRLLRDPTAAMGGVGGRKRGFLRT
jgi:hypothetical protein